MSWSGLAVINTVEKSRKNILIEKKNIKRITIISIHTPQN